MSQYKTHAPKRMNSIGQRARFKVKPQKVGYIVQSIRAFAFLDDDIERFNYTEAWRIQSNSKIEQAGDDDFLLPKQWVEDHSGRFYIIAYAWYQRSLDDDFCPPRSARAIYRPSAAGPVVSQERPCAHTEAANITQ